MEVVVGILAVQKFNNNVGQNKLELNNVLKNVQQNLLIALPLSSVMLKNLAKGFPSITRPYRISLGLPLSPSSACTLRIRSPGVRLGLRVVVGGAMVNTGGVSCTSSTATSRGHPAMLRVSSAMFVHGS